MTKNLIAFTGGGWNAMSGHSGWIGAALSSGQQISDSSLTLDQLFANTDSAAGNSGGSWFLSMLAYSPEFAADLSERPDQWFTTGYFGNQRQIFAQAPNSEGLTATEVLKDIANEITPVTLSNLTAEVLASYGASNSFFSGLSNFLTKVSKIELPGNDLASRIINAVTDFGESLVKDVIDALGLTKVVNDFIVETTSSLISGFINTGFYDASSNLLGVNLSEALVALLLKPIQEGSGANWFQAVQDTTFKTYNLKETLNKTAQEAERLSWADGKNILFPITASGFPIAIDKSESGSYLQSSLTPTSASALPQNETYLIPLTAKVASDSNKSTIEFPDSTLDFSAYLYPEVSGLSNPVQTKPIAFPADSSLTILEMVGASGSFLGAFGTPKAIENVINKTSENLLAKISNLKSNIASVIQSYPSKFKDTIQSTGDSFFNARKKPTDSGDIITDGLNKIYNIPIESAQLIFDEAVDLIPVKLFSDWTESISNWVFDKVYDNVENIFDFANPAYTKFSEVMRNFALPIDLGNDSITYFNDDKATNFSTSTPLRIFDGGLTDNTGVLSTIEQWQEDHADAPFVVNAFINSTAAVPLGTQIDSNLTGNVAVDFAKLFGRDGTRKNSSLVQNFPLSLSGGNTNDLPSIPAVYPYIFDGNAWDDPKQNAPVWEYQVSEDFGIAYYQMDVTTVENVAWGIEAGSKGTVNAFTTYNTNSQAGPMDKNGFDVWNQYQKNYDSITNGILNEGGYEHLLKALGILDFSWNPESARIYFNGDQGFHSDYALSLNSIDDSNDQYLACDIFAYSASGEKLFMGTIGGEKDEKGVSFADDNFDLFRFEQGTSLGFELREGGSNLPVEIQLDITNKSKSYTIDLTRKGTQKPVFSFDAGFATSMDDLPKLAYRDTTLRKSAHDTFIALSENSEWEIEVVSSGDYTNQFSLLQVEVDPVTGAMTLEGHSIDTDGFDQAARAAFAANNVFTSQVLKPFSTNLFSFTPEQTGFYAPALLTEENKIYVGNHDMLSGYSHSHMLGEMQFGFEDQSTPASDWDHNDALIAFIPKVTSI